VPYASKAQARAAFGGYLGEEMKHKALTWAHETLNMKSLPEHVKKASDSARKILKAKGKR